MAVGAVVLLAVVVVALVAGGWLSWGWVLAVAVAFTLSWAAVAAATRAAHPDDRARDHEVGAASPAAGPPARLVLSRGDDTAGVLRHIRVTLDGELVALLGPVTSVEIAVPPGRHRVRAAMDWTTSPALDLDLAPGERVEVRSGLPMSMLWRMITAPAATLTIARVDAPAQYPPNTWTP
ncbi:hypothetical protein [Cellulomonas sp. IC4_254]|uniref:hypothetical protein n=1 Tax=Cellulomonas sp. IC4_254 TaxID=2714040 RepID=UPI001422BD52|nr:hypothetical protein [Cellulomonas sp. IC4_254]NHT17838.1 hypothetical protein [Cellulomonas sp. IC4_254]